MPDLVEEELRAYLKCGQLEQGFCRVVCPDCGEEELVAFSCKRRGFCPSCCGRRMSDTAANLVDRVLPFAPYRQWVLSFPRYLRFAFARDSKAAALSASIALQEIFRWQRKQARARGISKPEVGAVLATQRHGSKIDLNMHHHCVLAPGVAGG